MNDYTKVHHTYIYINIPANTYKVKTQPVGINDITH